MGVDLYFEKSLIRAIPIKIIYMIYKGGAFYLNKRNEQFRECVWDFRMRQTLVKDSISQNRPSKDGLRYKLGLFYTVLFGHPWIMGDRRMSSTRISPKHLILRVLGIILF